MNQILVTNLTIKKVIIRGYLKTIRTPLPPIPSKSFFKNILTVSLGIITTCSLYLAYSYQARNYKESLAEGLFNSFSLSTLYSQNSNYVASPMQQESIKSDFSVIGIIKIDSIKISYPILSNINDNLLKIAPCRFYGPMPNQVGNLCIAAHNYNDNRFFSKLGKLKKGDIIFIYDSLRKYMYLLYLQYL